MLTRLVYHSENHLGAADGKMISSLNDIMSASNRNNEKVGVTGALLFDTLWFVQILEGERDSLSATLRRILRDERHDEVTIMDCRPIADRQFANWWMGLAFMRGEQKAMLARHGLQKFDPRQMSGDQAVAIARDFAQVGLDRQVT